MQEKLQALINKVQEEGVSKGEELAAAIVKDAEKKAERIVEEAERDAERTRKQAQEEADELKRNVESELRLSGEQAIQSLRQRVSNLIAYKAIGEPVQASFEDREFVKGLIEQLIQNWQPESNGSVNLRLLLPAEGQKELEQYFSAKAKELLDGELQINFDQKLERGFRIGPADGSYVVSFTDEDFEIFFMDYLRPATKKILYGNDQ